MYDTMCPLCWRTIEIPAQIVEVRGELRCPRCWRWLTVVDSHPLRLAAGTGDGESANQWTHRRPVSSGTQEERDG